LIKSYTSRLKIISVGNISAGGSGKTPLVKLIAAYLLSRDFRIVIISRGYKRKSNGIYVVYDGKNPVSDVRNAGDEAFMTVKSLLKNFKNFCYLSAENRADAVKYVEKNYKTDFILLDDAFQHRKIHRNCDIVLIDSREYSENNYLYKFLLPAGNLREPFININRASVVIFNHKVYDDKYINGIKNLNVPVYHSKYTFEGIFNEKDKTEELHNKDVLAVSGIANPGSFHDIIKMNGGNIYKNIIYPDHHDYNSKDIRYIKDNCRKDALIITTEKDFFKIAEFNGFVNDYPVYYLKIGMKIENENEFFKLLQRC
jgi:tetraacyldisaccharide 4'-kinase